MITETIDVQKAVQDLAAIRRAIDSTESRKVMNHPATMDANLVIQTMVLGISIALVGVELFTRNSMSTFMLFANDDRESQLMGLAQVGFTLPVLTMCIYFIVWRAARHAEQDLSSFVAAHFRYLRNLSLFSDLLTKFVPLSLLVLASKSEWIPPLLCLYIADYLIQGRLFTIQVRVSLALSIGCVAGAIAQYAFHSPLLIWPLLLFVAVGGISLACAWSRRQALSAASKQGKLGE